MTTQSRRESERLLYTASDGAAKSRGSRRAAREARERDHVVTHPKLPSGTPPERHAAPGTEAPTDDAELRALEDATRAEVPLPADGHVIGEPVTVLRVRYTGLARIGLLASCQRDGRVYDVGLAEVVFPSGSAGARLVARYREWLGFRSDSDGERPVDPPRPHKVGSDDITVGKPVELIVLACKSNALRCRLLGSTREVTLRTAVREEIPGSIITVTPRKQWTHARHPYLSGDVSAVRIDASVLGLVPLRLHRENDSKGGAGRDEGASGKHAEYRLQQAAPAANGDAGSNLLVEAQERLDAGEYAETDELLTKALALDLRCLEAHAMLGTRNLSHWPALALEHFELGVAIGSLTVRAEFDGILPWRLPDNRPFLRCLHGMARTLVRLGRGDTAAAVFRRLLRLDPADPLAARASLAALDAEKTRPEVEGAP